MPSQLNKYNTFYFKEIFVDFNDFKTKYESSPFPQTLTGTDLQTAFWLIYAKYMNDPIANQSVEQFKLKFFSTFYQYAPNWAKEIDIQSKLRNLTEEEMRAGTKTIHNQALNPATAPATSELEEIPFINQQQTAKYKKSILEGYNNLLLLLNSDLTDVFLSRFKDLFKYFVRPEKVVYYINEDDDEEEE